GAREDSRASPAAIAFTKNSFFGMWQSLGGPAGFAPALAESHSAVLLLHQDLRCSGCPGRLRTCNLRLNRAPLYRLSYWTRDVWRGRLDSNQGHPTSEAGVLPLNYAPTVWRD